MTCFSKDPYKPTKHLRCMGASEPLVQLRKEDTGEDPHLGFLNRTKQLF